MSITMISRQSTVQELVDEMDRRGRLIEEFESKIGHISKPDWRSLETAPEDGSSILATNADNGFMAVVFWDEEMWLTADGTGYHPSIFTHWMPPPAAPK